MPLAPPPKLGLNGHSKQKFFYFFFMYANITFFLIKSHSIIPPYRTKTYIFLAKKAPPYTRLLLL